MLLPILAQDAPPLPPTPIPTVEVDPTPPIWHVLLDNGLPLTILFVFLVAIVTVVVTQRRRDRCLTLFHKYRVATTSLAGRVVWGGLVVVKACAAGDDNAEINATLVPGATLDLRHHDRPLTLALERTRRVDLVAPRAKAVVYFGGDDPRLTPSRPDGIAPEQDVEQASQPPAAQPDL